MSIKDLRRFSISLLFIFVNSVFAQSGQYDNHITPDTPTESSVPASAVSAPTITKPAIAVYAIGDDAPREIRNALGVYILDALVNSGFYRAIERSADFLSVIEDEHLHQRSGAVDDDQIRALGRQAGVQFICVANVTLTMGASQISARIIDVETAEIVASGVSSGQLQSIDDLKQISAAVVFRMLGVRVQVDRDFELMTSNEQRILEQMIAQNIRQTIQESQRKKLPFWVGYGVSAIGAGVTAYAVMEANESNSLRIKHRHTEANIRRDRSNTAYWIGIPILLGGISIIIIF